MSDIDAMTPLERADVGEAVRRVKAWRAQEDLLLDCWLQWSYSEMETRRGDGGLSTLENLRAVLSAAGRIDSDGKVASR